MEEIENNIAEIYGFIRVLIALFIGIYLGIQYERKPKSNG